MWQGQTAGKATEQEVEHWARPDKHTVSKLTDLSHVLSLALGGLALVLGQVARLKAREIKWMAR